MSKIDVHHHVYAPVFTEGSSKIAIPAIANIRPAINASGGDPSGWYVPEWTIEKDRELCKRIGVKTAILSATAPGPSVKTDPTEAARLARQINDFNAKLRDEDPEHYGFFASVPSMLDTERCLAEIRHAMDVLKADGIVLMTRYGRGSHYLGHADFIPVWQELNKRNAVVFIHPTHVDHELVNEKLPQPMFDYPHETGRTAVDLIVSNVFCDHARDCKIILSHAGGSLPMLLGRVAGVAPFSPWATKSREDIYQEAAEFYYDTALSSSEGQLLALQAIAKPGHILFGSDFPNAPPDAIDLFSKQLDENRVLTAEHMRAINGDAGKVLFPRLSKY